MATNLQSEVSFFSHFIGYGSPDFCSMYLSGLDADLWHVLGTTTTRVSDQEWLGAGH